MTAVSQRLQLLNVQIPIDLEKDPFIFAKYLSKQGIDFFQPLILIHLDLSLEYSALCRQISENNVAISKKQRRKMLESALIFSELLSYIYENHLNVPREVLRLKAHQKWYHRQLKQTSHSSYQPQKSANKSAFFTTHGIREATIALNGPRAITARVTQIVDIMVPLINNLSDSRLLVVALNEFIHPTMLYLNWIFYLPRFLTNLVLILKHTIKNPWMLENEQKMDVCTRVRAQLQRRGFELVSDFLWLTLGLLTCFTGGLVPAYVYLPVMVTLIDSSLAWLRKWIDDIRFAHLAKTYENLKIIPSSDESLEFKHYQDCLAKRMSLARKERWLHVINCTGLLVGFCLSLPIFLCLETFPVFAVLLMFTTTLITAVQMKRLHKEKNSDPLLSSTDISSLNPRFSR